MSKNLSFKITPLKLLRFTLPSMVMMLVMALYTVVDGMFVSRFINTDAFSAVNIVYPLSSIVVAVGTMFGTGTAAVVSRKLGEGKQKEANALLTFILIVTAAIGVILTAVCQPLVGALVRLLGADETIAPYCVDYARPLIWFFPASILQLLFQCMFSANGKPALGLITTVAGGLANAFLDFLFIVVFEMGISGAAVATGIGYCIPAVFGLFYFSFNRRGSLFFTRPAPSFHYLFQAMGNGSSEMVSNVSTSVTTLLFNIIMMRLVGPDGVSAIGVILYMDFVLVALNLGYSLGAAPVISYNYGAGNRAKLRKIFAISMVFCGVLGALTALISVLASSPIASVFVEGGTPVHELAAYGLKIFAVCYLFKGFNIFASAMFTAFSNGLISALISLLRSLVFLITALTAMSALMGLDGVFAAVPAAELLTLLVAVTCICLYKKRYGYAGKKDRADERQITE